MRKVFKILLGVFLIPVVLITLLIIGVLIYSIVSVVTYESTKVETDSWLQMRNIPKYAVVAQNPNGHKIFIVTQATRVEQFETIVTDYKRRYETPDHPWVINFFTDKEKALRVRREWLEPPVGNYWDKWVYQEDVDHSAIAQWTSWDGVTLDRW